MNERSRGSLLTAVLRRLTATPATAPAPARGSEEFGLLRPIARIPDLNTARSVRGMLEGAGVRATITTGADGRVRVLVFPEDQDRAERLVSWAL